MRIINLTPHSIVFKNDAGEELVIQPEGGLARCAEVSSPVGETIVNGFSVPIVSKAFGEIEGLPEPVEGTIYIVSGLAAQAAWAAGRVADVFCPGGSREGRRRQNCRLQELMRQPCL